MGVIYFANNGLYTELKDNSGTPCFKVKKEFSGIYCALPVYFGGEAVNLLPHESNLVRQSTQWTPSCHDVNVMNASRKIVEETCTDSSAAFAFE